MEGWKGKRVVLTGATRGVGYESAKLFLAAGAEVFGTGQDAARLARVTQEFAALGTFHPFQARWADPAAPAALAEAVGTLWPAVDLLVNNAAVQTWKSDWFAEGAGLLETQMRINVLAPHELVFRLVPLLLRGREPRIIQVGSGAGTLAALTSSPDMPTYRLTKFALAGDTLLWAAHLKGRVAVNLMDPGWLKTDLGGPQAPGEPADGGRRMWEVANLPWAETGGFWHGKEKISF